MNKLEASYSLAVQRRDEARKELARVIKEQQVIKWELEHQKRRNKDYEKQLDKHMTEIAAIKSHLPLIGERSLLKSQHYTAIMKNCAHNMRSIYRN